MVSIPHKDVEHKVEKHKHMKLEVMQPNQKQIRTSSTWINHTRSVHMKCYSRD